MAEHSSAEEIQLVLDDLHNFKEQLIHIRNRKRDDELYAYDENEPWWNRWLNRRNSIQSFLNDTL